MPFVSVEDEPCGMATTQHRFYVWTRRLDSHLCRLNILQQAGKTKKTLLTIGGCKKRREGRLGEEKTVFITSRALPTCRVFSEIMGQLRHKHRSRQEVSGCLTAWFYEVTSDVPCLTYFYLPCRSVIAIRWIIDKTLVHLISVQNSWMSLIICEANQK